MAALSRSNGTRVPTRISPSATGRVSSKMGSLVKLRMEKLSSHLSGQRSVLPSLLWVILICRENIVFVVFVRHNHSLALRRPGDFAVFAGHQETYGDGKNAL